VIIIKKIVVFELNNQQFGLDIEQVSSIERLIEITNIPQSERYIKGIIHLRNEIIPILDLKKKFNMTHNEYRHETKILIININKLQIGLLVDEAKDVIDVKKELIEKPMNIITEHNIAIEGIVKLHNELLLLLNMEKILHIDEIKSVVDSTKVKA